MLFMVSAVFVFLKDAYERAVVFDLLIFILVPTKRPPTATGAGVLLEQQAGRPTGTR